MAFSSLILFRTQATLSGKQKRQLQEKLEFVQEVVRSKKVRVSLTWSCKHKWQRGLMAVISNQKKLYKEYLHQSVSEQDMNL